jgi:hypothetical protein
MGVFSASVGRVTVLAALVVVLCGERAAPALAQSAADEGVAPPIVHFVPNFQRFWDNSKNWTTNYGPAYRDTVLQRSNFVPCTGQYALCFHSGPEPLPCKLGADGRFADCVCQSRTGVNFVLITAILNERVYQETIARCGPEGKLCVIPDTAPVCKAIHEGRFIPGADLISTYSPSLPPTLSEEPADSSDKKPKLTICPKGPYAGCMTAPCNSDQWGRTVCSCPVFYGPFQLVGRGAQCTLGSGLINSASYNPSRDTPP